MSQLMPHEVQKAAAIFVEGPYAKRSIIKLGCPEKKVLISHLGVDLRYIKKIKRTWKKNSPFKILIAATFTSKKGIIIALKAINKIIEEVSFEIEITLIGDARKTDESVRYKQDLINFIENSNLKNTTKSFGFISYQKVLELSYEHHLFVQTSLWGENQDCEGGFPVIITDMMATGMPVLGSTHCDIPEIVIDKSNGFVVPENDTHGYIIRDNCSENLYGTDDMPQPLSYFINELTNYSSDILIHNLQNPHTGGTEEGKKIDYTPFEEKEFDEILDSLREFHKNSNRDGLF